MLPSRLSFSSSARSSSRANRPRASLRRAHAGHLALVRPVAGPAAPDLVARLEAAAGLLQADPDAAALVLEGAPRAVIVHWYARQGLAAPAPERLLADLAARDEVLALRLRLALRAPDVAARLGHLRALVRLLDG